MCKSLKTGEMVDLAALSCRYLKELEATTGTFLQAECNKGELTAFIAFALSFPSNFLALVDTYNVLK